MNTGFKGRAASTPGQHWKQTPSPSIKNIYIYVGHAILCTRGWWWWWWCRRRIGRKDGHLFSDDSRARSSAPNIIIKGGWLLVMRYCYITSSMGYMGLIDFVSLHWNSTYKDVETGSVLIDSRLNHPQKISWMRNVVKKSQRLNVS